MRLRDLTPEVVDGRLAELVAPAPSRKARLGATSARTVRKVLSMALREAVERGRLPRNPVALTLPPRRDRSYRKQSWTLDETRRFLAGVGDHRPYAAFHLGLVTGLRRGELLGLRWVDVDVERCQLVVAQQLSIEGGRPSLKQLKTETSQRLVTSGPGTAGVLSAHQERQDAEAAVAGEAGRGAGSSSPRLSAAGSTRTTSAARWTPSSTRSECPRSRPEACGTQRNRSAG
ncbi:MAG: site-specific integrase [Acidimicrobiales bacterium]